MELGTLGHQQGCEQTWKDVLHFLESKMVKSRAQSPSNLGVNWLLADCALASLPYLYLGSNSSTTAGVCWGRMSECH